MNDTCNLYGAIDVNSNAIKLVDLSIPLRQRKGKTWYYFNPRPLIHNRRTRNEGFGGYLSRDGKEINAGSHVRLRVVRASENYSRAHEYYCDDFQDQTIYGIVARLTQSRGYLAGWTMGEGMCCSFDATIYDDIGEASRAADSEAESAAEKEREYQAEQRANDEAEEALSDLRSANV